MYVLFYSIINIISFGFIKPFKKYYVKILLTLVIFIFSALRYDVGNDFLSYKANFEIMNYKFYEIGNGMLYALARFLGDFQFYIIISSAIITYGYTRFIFRYSRNIYLSIIMYVTLGYFMLGSFNHIRQFMSISIFLISLIQIDKGNIKKSILLNILSSTIHISGLFGLGVTILLKAKIKTYYFLSIIPLILLKDTIITLVMNVLGFGLYLDPRWAETMNNERNTVFIIVYLSLVILTLFITSLATFKQKIFLRKMLFISGILISVSLMLPKAIPNMFFFRLNNFLLPAIIILIPNVINRFEKLNKFLVYLSVLTLFGYTYLALVVNGKDANLTPYKIFLFG